MYSYTYVRQQGFVAKTFFRTNTAPLHPNILLVGAKSGLSAWIPSFLAYTLCGPSTATISQSVRIRDIRSH
ncbi:hypothetical protein GQ602_007291 [Ophiocordyceps camponoti-floridani]|uniref:Uncharacterized protein n=1 Tax=Ophiocordyceps camponoti-floridani TaxID=2030778 RepID=A0A8H4Q0Y9_9HYPO|nr:hypothetical protein GQ602_007291 [Ophiocordyceps camponoti-floridani]